MAGILVPVVSPIAAQPAEAAVASDWDPGYIIDDKIFYNSNSMTASEIQSFLNAQVPNCNAGATCVKDYGQATASIAADRYCNGYQGAAWHSAAQIIDIVARSCGISQQVLIVLLQKEQGLITSRAPSAWAYQAATGQSCPDTAPCDPAFSGFFYQVYYAARQFEVYRMNPTLFGYREQRWNNILYNPNRACGTSSVYIHNQATAALYIYTPYTPNPAALANLYGTGDGCSSYGNRNFWRLFTDWFGNPRSYEIHPGFVSYWNSTGGATGSLGAAASYPVYVEANGQGWYQRFQKGTLYGSYRGGTVVIPNGEILSAFDREGGPSSGVGWPNAAQICVANGCWQSFTLAGISGTPAWGGHIMWGGIYAYWQSAGGMAALGPALNDVRLATAGKTQAWVQHFEKAVVTQGAYGIQTVPASGIQSYWHGSGGGEGWLGWPMSAYACASGQCVQVFEGGTVSSSAWGVHASYGTFVSYWNARGGLSGMGAALNDIRTSSASGGGWIQNFGAGVVAQSSRGIFTVPYGRMQELWSSSGAERGSFGWPIAEKTCTGSQCIQAFQNAILSDSSWGTWATWGSIASAWTAGGGISSYGAAVNGIRYTTASGGGWIQHFGSGVMSQTQTGAPIFTPYGPILETWYAYGGERTWLGWPTGAQVCDASGCTQQFQNGVARWSSTAGVSFQPR
ncbi:hypothetical protein AB0N73_07520 [Microbacterium sp. NPDC089189]|uniref:LGFP repeat-containing protein n=1 Tax=Microbacterium sp. NPDC089189 TaxID=3154972 RepID=UPI00343E846B